MVDKVKVRIKTAVKMRYDQTVEIDRKYWEKIKKTTERNMECSAMSPLGDLLNLLDVLDWDDFEFGLLEVVDEDGNPVDPEDYYSPV